MHATDQMPVGARLARDRVSRSDRGHAALRRQRYSASNYVYNITAVTIDRRSFFHEFAPSCAAARCFEHAALLNGATMLAWVLMPDHVHWLIQLGADPLPIVVARLKSASARETNQVLGRSGALWGRAYHDHALRDDENLINAARYIVANPLRAGLVKRVGDYPFWNAIWL